MCGERRKSLVPLFGIRRLAVPKIIIPSIEEKPGYIYMGGRYVPLDSIRQEMTKRLKEEAQKTPSVPRVTLDQKTIDSLMKLRDELQDIPRPMEQMEEEADTVAAQMPPAETADTETEEHEETDSTMNEHE